MKPVLVALFALLVSFGLTTHDAEAARLGGGGSSGMSRSGSLMNRQAVPPRPVTPAPSAVPSTPAAPAAAPARSPWMGMLGGLALGAGIGALLGHFGMGGLGGGFGNILMLLLIGGAAFFLIRMFMRRNAPAAQPMQYAGSTYDAVAAPVSAAALPAGSAPTALLSGSVPAGFDVEGFVRQAKLNFVRLQAANDAGNMEDIRAFTTPEMFAEIQMQYEERGRAKQETDVQQLDASLLDVSEEAGRHVVSVRFFGRIREAADAMPEALDEVWHLSKPVNGSSGWVIAGIQQFQ